MPLFRALLGPNRPPSRPLSSKVAFLALNLALWDRLAWLKSVLALFPDPAEAFRRPPGEWPDPGIPPSIASRLAEPGLLDRAAEEFDRSLEKGYSLLTLADAEYPSLLREIFDPPCVLYGIGRIDVLESAAVAVVGSRHPTPYGRGMAERLARDLAERGLVVVSGLALGIDTAAHVGALGGGRTVAVLGSGLDVPYPKSNRKLFDRIAVEGAVISEFPLGTDPLAANFPRRNRIISGLSLGVVVVQAGKGSGSLITANYALEQGRDVFAVPGNVGTESQGTNQLIKEGAKLVVSSDDILEEILPQWRREENKIEEVEDQGKRLSEEERRLYALLGDAPP